MERREEIRFGLWVLLVPFVLLIVGEIGAHKFYSAKRPTGFDWAALEIATRVPGTDIPYRFQPGASYEHLAFDDLGLRSPGLRTPKPDETIRLAVVSNSTLFNAVLPEEKTFIGLLTQELTRLHPECSFDYANFSGPAYTLEFLAQEWPTLRDQVDPDVTIILAGSPYEAIPDPDGRRSGSGAAAAAPPHFWEAPHLRRFVEAVLRRLSLARAITMAREDTASFKREFTQNVSDMRVDLASLVPEGRAILIGDRAQVRDADSTALAALTRELRYKRNIKRPESALELTETTISAMAQTARSNGWSFVDAMAQIPADPEHFRDAEHLTGEGTADLMELVLPEVEAILPECRSTRGS